MNIEIDEPVSARHPISDILTFTPTPVRPAGDLASVCRRYLSHLQAKGYRPNTVLAYRRDLEQLVGFCAARDVRLIQHVSGPLLDDFTQAIVQGEGSSPRTAARKLAAVKSLGAYAVARGLIEANPAEKATPVRYRATPVLAPDEATILRLIDSIPADTALGARDRAMFRLMYVSALRVSELCDLDMYDPASPPLNTVEPSGVIRIRGKGGDMGYGVADDEALELLFRWRNKRHRFARESSPPALFLSERGTRLTRAAVAHRLQQHAARLDLHITCHMLRHRRGGEVIRHAGPRAAQMLLRHRSLSTTVNTYGAESAERLRHQVRTLAPVGGVRS